VLNAGNVVADWNAIRSTTIVPNGGKIPPAFTIGFAYWTLAMYDAVTPSRANMSSSITGPPQLSGASIDPRSAPCEKPGLESVELLIQLLAKHLVEIPRG
jgi:hypothetical protein